MSQHNRPAASSSSSSRSSSSTISSGISISGAARIAGARAAPRQRVAAPPRGDTVRCSGLLDGLLGRFGGGGAGADTAASGFVERPAYAKRDMLKIGDMDVSPMGFGTWSW